MKKKVYFLSDMHLGASYLPDGRAAEKRVADFLLSIKEQAADVYLMGDVLDYWYEYRTVVPRGYVRFFGALAALADAGVRLHWYIGNHDIWLFDYVRDEIGVEVVDGYRVEEICGKKFFLSHGDGLGRLSPGFRFIRSMFRNRLCQKLYAAVHPRWTVPLAHRWSAGNRDFGHYEEPVYAGADADPLALFAKDYLQRVDGSVDYFVFGHQHMLVRDRIGPHSQMIILGDWLTRMSYAVFDGQEMKLCQYDAGKEKVCHI